MISKLLSFLVAAFSALSYHQTTIAQPLCDADPLTARVGRGGCDISFNLPSKFDDGDSTSVALNKDGWLIETHVSAHDQSMWYRLGWLRHDNIHVTWGTTQRLPMDGYVPAVTLNNLGQVIIAYANRGSRNGSSLYYTAGMIDLNGDFNQAVKWHSSGKYYAPGFRPSVSLNDAGNFVFAHETSGDGNELYFKHGKIGNPPWYPKEFPLSFYGHPAGDVGTKYDNGANPRVAMNNGSDVVFIHQVNTELLLHYHRTVYREFMQHSPYFWTPGSTRFNDDGKHPAVTLSDNGIVVAMLVNGKGGKRDAIGFKERTLQSMIGQLDPANKNSILWAPPVTSPKYYAEEYYDSPEIKWPSVSTNGRYVIGTHENSPKALNYTVSPIRLTPVGP